MKEIHHQSSAFIPLEAEKRPRPSRPLTGFTLIELMIGVAIFAVAGTLLTGILYNASRVQNREEAARTVSEQSTLVLQQIQQRVKDASLIELGQNATSSTLLIRRADTSTSTIFASGTSIYITENGQTSALTNANVSVDSLIFTKFANPPARDSVKIDLTLSYASQNKQFSFSKPFSSTISRVSAAVFDSSLIPGADNAYDVGLVSPNRWRNANFSGGVYIGGSLAADQGNNTFYVDSVNDRVGVGTSTPATLFSVATGTNIFNVTTGGNVGVGTTTPATLFTVATGTNIFNVTKGGNVGIGTSTPAYKLTVVGIIQSVLGGFKFPDGTVQTTAATGGVVRAYLSGLTLSYSNATTFGVAAGTASDNANAVMMTLASAFTKTTSAWAVGTGSGGAFVAINANTWYHVFLIRKTSDGSIDVGFDTNVTAANIPAGYSAYRRIGSLKTNGSSQWTNFVQDGDYFRWFNAVSDVSISNPPQTAVTRTLTVPTGVNVQALLAVRLGSTNSNVANGELYLSDLAVADESTGGGLAQVGNIVYDLARSVPLGVYASWSGTIRTNTSAQIRSLIQSSNNSVQNLDIKTLGWYDSRGTGTSAGGGGGGASDISVRLRKGLDTNMGSGSWVPIAFDIEDYDTDNMHSLVADLDRLNFPTAGKYLVVCSFQIGSVAGGGQREAQIILNGVTVIAWERAPVAADNVSALLNLSMLYNFAANDFVSCQGRQDSGNTGNLAGGTSYSPIFAAQRVQ